jgi:predicted lipoprotein with Yx(FWY)xxD motif
MKNLKTSLAFGLIGLILLFGNAQSALAAPASMDKSGVLADDKGMTLYIFDKDTANSGKSACVADCLAKWPAFKAAAGAKAEGNFSIITRDDGSMQWAYKGKPLYYFDMDKAAGDKKGDGRGDVWHVVK